MHLVWTLLIFNFLKYPLLGLESGGGSGSIARLPLGSFETVFSKRSK